MKFSLKPSIVTGAAVCSLMSVASCGLVQVQRDQAAISAEATSRVEATVKARPVVLVHEGDWLLGEKIRASKPQPEIYDKLVVFKQTTEINLSDVANWIAENVGVRAVVDASAQGQTSAPSNPSTPPLGARTVSALPPFGPGSVGRLPDLPSVLSVGSGAPMSAPRAPLRYTGKFSDFLDVVNARFNVWSRYRDGTVTFFKTETRTFTLPTIADASSMSGTISSGDSGASSGGGTSSSGSSSGSASGGSSSGGSSSGSGGQNMSLSASVNPLLDIEKTAAAIGGPGSTAVADKNLGILTVTGSPPQCDRIEDWVKSLNVMFGKQVAIEVHVYQIQRTQEENYGANLTLAYKSKGGHTGVSMAGAPAPTVTSSTTPMTFGASILGGTLSGSSATIQALSTLGNVSQVVARSGITQNGKLLAMQAAKQQSYVASTQTTQTASVGSTTTMQTAVLTPGFTSSFLPKVIDGRVQIDFDITLSDLLSLPTFTSSGSSVQLPTIQLTRLEQSVTLRPGETLVLTGMRQQNASTTNNGVGSPYLPLFGGGVDAQGGDTIIAVVITARLL